MSYALLWVEILLVSLLFTAWVLTSPWIKSRRILLIVGITSIVWLFSPPAVAMFKMVQLYVTSGLNQAGMWWAISLFAARTLGVALLVLLILKKNAAGTRLTWPRGRLLGAWAICFALTIMTLWNMSLQAQIELQALRSEAGAIALSTMPPPLADADNALPVYGQFGKAFDAALTEDDRNKSRPFGQSALHAPETLDFIKRQEKALALARRAADTPGIRLDLDYAHPQVANIVPLNAQFRIASALLGITAREEDGHAAVEDCSRMVAIAGHSHALPYIINGLAGFVLDARADAALADVLPTVKNKEDLVGVRTPDAEATARDFARQVRDEEPYAMGLFSEDAKELGGSFAWIIWAREDVRLHRTRLRELQDRLKKPYFETASAPETAAPRGILSRTILNPSSVHKWGSGLATTQAADQAALIAVAATHYRLDKGSYPAELNALVPAYLPDTPVDPFDGKPMRMKKRDDGSLVIYSVNSDGADNGGDVDVTKVEGARDVGLILRAPSEPQP